MFHLDRKNIQYDIPCNKRQLEFSCLNVFKNFGNVNTRLRITLILIGEVYRQ